MRKFLALAFFFALQVKASSLMCVLFLNWDIDNIISKAEKKYADKTSVVLTDKDEDQRNPRFAYRAEVLDGKIESLSLRDIVSDYNRTITRAEVGKESEYLSLSYFEDKNEYSVACWNFP